MKKLICTALVLLLAICPVAMAEEAGALDYSFTFATTDLDGNIVTSAEIYAGNKITMINFWATWCPPCVGELAELAGVHTQLQEAGCGVVGILMDSYDPGAIETAKALMAQNGTNYPVLALSEDLYPLAQVINLIPTTVFVDSSGTLVGTPIVGALVDQYVPAVKALLEP
ncbi:MAG: TlpA family protein disulfide reductase [Clostridia bacterium]|nr:TlpA family protein disulfide reductase [Clostridia bacterium]